MDQYEGQHLTPSAERRPRNHFAPPTPQMRRASQAHCAHPEDGKNLLKNFTRQTNPLAITCKYQHCSISMLVFDIFSPFFFF